MLSASDQPGLGLKINEDILTLLQSWEWQQPGSIRRAQ
jgi:hypothetical protein